MNPKFNIGDVACMKITGEEMMVLEVLENETLRVRRPSMSSEGILHKVEMYHEFELETKDERQTRELTERQSLATRLMGTRPAEDMDMGKYVA